jgi:hypothetical protein
MLDKPLLILSYYCSNYFLKNVLIIVSYIVGQIQKIEIKEEKDKEKW